jgi:glutathione peroxidase
MYKALVFTGLCLLSSSAMAQSCPDLLKFFKRKLNSTEMVNMCSEYAGKTVLFVNTASKCGYTPQFEGLEKLYSEYKDQGLVVLGFPSHDFKQEFSDESKTAEFCELTYGVEFPMFEATKVKGENADLLYKMLARKSGTAVGWNFYKYLMDKNGELVGAYPSKVKPSDEKFLADLKSALGK